MGLLLSLKRRAGGPGLGTDPQVRRGRKPHPLAPRGEVRASRVEDKRCHFLGQRGRNGGGDADLGIHASPMVCTHSRTQKTFRTASPTSGLPPLPPAVPCHDPLHRPRPGPEPGGAGLRSSQAKVSQLKTAEVSLTPVHPRTPQPSLQGGSNSQNLRGQRWPAREQSGSLT